MNYTDIPGWQLGSDSVVQVPNNVSNHLTTGLLKYFHTTGRFASGINLFEKLRTKNVEVSSLLAKVLFMGNEEVQAVRVLTRICQAITYGLCDARYTSRILDEEGIEP
jgi:hypothetical protein